MSVMGFQTKLDEGLVGGRGELYPVVLGIFWNFVTAEPLKFVVLVRMCRKV